MQCTIFAFHSKAQKKKLRERQTNIVHISTPILFYKQRMNLPTSLFYLVKQIILLNKFSKVAHKPLLIEQNECSCFVF